MSRAAGYEELPGGVEEPPYVPQPGATPAATQQPVLGVPVPQLSPTHQFSPTQQGFSEHLTGLPTAAEEWDGAAVLMSIWLGCSVASLLLSLLTANTFAITGSICAAVGAATHRFARCRGGADLATLVNRVHTLSIVAASLCGLVAVLGTLVAFGLSATCGHASGGGGGPPDPKTEEACAALTEITLVYALWYVFFTMLCTAVSRRTRRMRLLLNPVSSGLVVV